MGRFIIGTGRCGSTLLSRMLDCNPRVLNLHEFYAGLDWGKRFQQAPMKGTDFRDLIATPHPILTLVLERGYRPVEVMYPFDRPGVRYRPDRPVPYALVHALPPLSGDPDQLFDDVCTFLAEQPAQSAPAHAEALFTWLCRRSDAEVWIERSASSIAFLDQLDASFPGSRFLHLHRQGEEAALSMREHPVFRLAVMLTYGIPIGEGGEIDQIDGLAKDSDQVSRMLATRPPAEYFGRWWSEQLMRGLAVRASLDASHYREVRFEDLLAEPVRVLGEVAEFLDLPDPRGGWRETAAALLRTEPANRIEALGSDERERLAEACRPGKELLGRA